MIRMNHAKRCIAWDKVCALGTRRNDNKSNLGGIENWRVKHKTSYFDRLIQNAIHNS